MGNEKANDPMDFMVVLEKLKKICEVDNLKMSDYGIKESDIERLTHLTEVMADDRLDYDPIRMTAHDIKNIFIKSYK